MTRTVLVFGTFDGLDEGHRAFLKEAAKEGSRLVAVVARDQHVRILKGHLPRFSEKERLAAVRDLPEVDDILLSDETLGSYQLVANVQPNVIVLGFDQDDLDIDLHRWFDLTGRSIPIVRLPKYETNT